MQQLNELMNGKAYVLVFISNTNELQRFVLSGAFSEIAQRYKIHYVLPKDYAEQMRLAASNWITTNNSSEISVSDERLKLWTDWFVTACKRYANKSLSFAIRAHFVSQKLPVGIFLKKILYRFGFLRIGSFRKIKQFSDEMSRLEPHPEIVSLINHFRPLFCLVPSSLLDFFCNDVVFACDAKQVTCVVLQSGWDNLSSKGILPKKTLYLGCWGLQSEHHAVQIQGIAKHYTDKLGAPHYEFLKPADENKISQYRRELDIRQDDKLLLFGGSFRQFDEVEILLQLDAAVESGVLPKMKIIYRPHPWRAARQFEDDFFKHNWFNVIFDPDMIERYKHEISQPGYIKKNAPMFDMQYLALLLSSIDAVISPMSTLLIESLIMDKPTMAIAFSDGKHLHNPSVTSQMTHFTEIKKSKAIVWCSNKKSFLKSVEYLFSEKTEIRTKTKLAVATLLPFIVTRVPGSYAERLLDFCKRVEPEARKKRAILTASMRTTISHAYGALQIAQEFCQKGNKSLSIPDYWMHGWIPSYHNLDPAFIALHKKPGQHQSYDYKAQIEYEKEHVAQWVSRQDQADYLLSHGYKKVKAIGLPVVYVPQSIEAPLPNSLLVLPPHSHRNHGPNDPLAERYAEMIASLKPRFDRICVGLHEDDIAKNQWISSFEKRKIEVFCTADQSDSNTLVRLHRLLHAFEYVTTNGYGSHIALAAYCGAKVSVYGPFAEFPMGRMKATHAVKMFPHLLKKAHWLCAEEALRQNYPFLFVEPEKATSLVDWGAEEVGAGEKLTPDEMCELFSWNKIENEIIC